MRGIAAQALLDRGWGKPKVKVVTEERQDYIAALQAVNERLRQAWGWIGMNRTEEQQEYRSRIHQQSGDAALGKSS